jgi:hypothetical protein
MMKTYEVLAWSSVTAFDKAFFFEIEALDFDSAMAKYREISESPEYSWRKLRVERWDTREDRMRAEAVFGKYEDIIAQAHANARRGGR